MTKFVGILNITPDSFFDGGRYNEKENALKQLEILLESGADIIDVGAESTRPDATLLSPSEEWERIKNILPEIINVARHHKPKRVEVSLDSRHFQNVAKALIMGAYMINDVSGFEDENMIKLASRSGKKIVVMHNLGIPANKNKIVNESLDVIEVLISWMEDKLEKLQEAGIQKSQIIFDPGVGFGKNALQSIKIIKEIDRFRELDLPLYVGHSNKSFLDQWEIENCKTREEKTEFVSKYLISCGVEYLRVHKV